MNRPEPTFMGSSTEAIDREALFELGKNRLLRLGLLKSKFSSVKKGQLPEFDPKTGGFEGRVEISYLGRMLLRSAGTPASIDADE